MLGRWLSNLRWALLIAIFAGPGFAYFTYTEAQTLKRVMAEGVEATATVAGGESRSGRRSGTTYKIQVVWTDQAGAERAETIAISSDYAATIIEGEFLTVDSVIIKYLADDPSVSAVVVEDAPTQIAENELFMMLGAGAGVVGLVGSAFFFLAGRRKPQPA
jgi:hypothetical protein